MCEYVEDKELFKSVDKPISSCVVNNDSIVTLKEIYTGKKIVAIYQQVVWFVLSFYLL